MIIVPILFLYCSYLTGFLLTSLYLNQFRGLIKIAISIIIGLLFSTWIAFLFSLTLNYVSLNPIIYATALTILIQLIILAKYRKYLRKDYSLNWWNIGLFSLALMFSWILFSHTFSYDMENHNIIISRLIWSDYGFHLPLIRSFSYGNNLLLEHPVFANEPLRYHFMFNFLVAVLETGGIPLGYALNLPSALSFSCMMVFLFYISKRLFNNSNFIGFTTVVLFLLNSSLTYVEFFKQYGKQTAHNMFKTFWNMNEYVSFGPWGGDIISAFWNLNIYLNQRHLAFGFCIALMVIIFLINEKFDWLYKHSKKSYYFIGAISGLLVLWHGQVFLCLLLILGLFFLLFSDRKNVFLSIVIALIIALPQILYLQLASQNIESSFKINPGYLVIFNMIPVEYFQTELLNSITSAVYSFYKYWFFNIGLSLITLTASFFIVDRQRKYIFLIFLSLFILGSTFQFSIEMAGNHKIFNLWIVLANMYTAYLLYLVYSKFKLGTIISILLLIPLTFSGIFDLIPIKNDGKVVLDDFQKQPMAAWVFNNTNQDDVFLTTYRILNPISLAGRRTTQGWPYFAWSTGYDTKGREDLVKDLYNPKSLKDFCEKSKLIHFDYVQTELQFEKEPHFEINYRFFDDNFVPVFHDKTSRLEEKIYPIDNVCNNDNIKE